MNKEVALKASPRRETGKTAARRLRRAGLVPATIYGHGEASEALQVDGRELEQLLGRISVENTLVDLDIEGRDSQRVLIREVQRHPWRPVLLHVDFFHIRADEKIRVEVPLRLVGTPTGVRNSGGILQQSRHELEVECLPHEIPEYFELDVSQLDIGDSLHVADLNTGGVRPLEDLDLTLCSVLPPAVEPTPEEEAAAAAEVEGEAEPEVIGRAREGEEEGGEGEGEED